MPSRALAVIAALAFSGILAAAAPATLDELRGEIRLLLSESPDSKLPFADALALEIRFANAISSPLFAQLDTRERHEVLSKGSAFAQSISDDRQALVWSNLAALLPEAGSADTGMTFRVAVRARNGPAIHSALKALARDHPESLGEMEPALMLDAISILSNDKSVDRTELLGALFDARYRFFGRMEPSGLWQDLLVELHTRGQLDRAAEVATRIDDVSVLIALRSDWRYEPLLKGNPYRDDLAGALRKQLETTRQVFEEHPTSAIAFSERLDTLLLAGQLEAAIQHSHDAIKRAGLTARASTIDSDEIQPRWVYDSLSDAHARLGDWDAAVQDLLQGSRFGGLSAGNTSQTLNLAGLYCQIGQPREALKEIARVRSASEYGFMVKDSVQVCAASQLGRSKDVSEALARLRARRELAPRLYLHALVRANELDAAAVELVSLLKDEKQRLAMLARLQDDTSGARTPVELEQERRMQLVLERPEVKAVLDSVGRVERYRF